jgi:hypothetical protein
MAEIIRNNSSSRRIRKGHIVIKGFAPDDSELYITRGDGFEIRGGSPQTHARMLEVAKTIMAVVQERGYDIEHLSRREYLEISEIVQDIQSGKICFNGDHPPVKD